MAVLPNLIVPLAGCILPLSLSLFLKGHALLTPLSRGCQMLPDRLHVIATMYLGTHGSSRWRLLPAMNAKHFKSCRSPAPNQYITSDKRCLKAVECSQRGLVPGGCPDHTSKNLGPQAQTFSGKWRCSLVLSTASSPYPAQSSYAPHRAPFSLWTSSLCSLFALHKQCCQSGEADEVQRPKVFWMSQISILNYRYPVACDSVVPMRSS